MSTTRPTTHRIPVIFETAAFIQDARPDKLYRNLICREFAVFYLRADFGKRYTLCLSLVQPDSQAIGAGIAYPTPTGSFDDDGLRFTVMVGQWESMTEAMENLLDECFDVCAIGPTKENPTTGYIWLEPRA